MNTKILEGLGVALVTPFHEDGNIDWPGLKNLLEHTYAQGKGVDYWVILGTTGEAVTMRPAEKIQILDFIRENNPQELPLVYGIAGNDTRSVLETLHETPLEGVDAILSASPSYNKPSQAGIVEHFKRMADASPSPILLYNVPGRTASNMEAETTLQLAEHPNILGIKEASGNLLQCMQIAKHKPNDFLLLSGEDMLSNPIISVGGVGAISVLANAFPQIFKHMISHCLRGNLSQSQESLKQLLDLHPLMYTESNPVGVKQALAFLKVCQPWVRLPLLPASEALQNLIRAQMPMTTLKEA